MKNALIFFTVNLILLSCGGEDFAGKEKQEDGTKVFNPGDNTNSDNNPISKNKSIDDVVNDTDPESSQNEVTVSADGNEGSLSTALPLLCRGDANRKSVLEQVFKLGKNPRISVKGRLCLTAQDGMTSLATQDIVVTVVCGSNPEQTLAMKSIQAKPGFVFSWEMETVATEVKTPNYPFTSCTVKYKISTLNTANAVLEETYKAE